MERLLNAIKQYRKEQADMLDWSRRNGHPVMANFDEGGLNACDKIITIVESVMAENSDELSNCNKPLVSNSEVAVCDCDKPQLDMGVEPFCVKCNKPIVAN